MISNKKGCHYLPVKICITKRITSKQYGNFYFQNCLHSFTTKNKLESHKNVCENEDFCDVIKSSEDTKLLEFNQYQKSDKAPFNIYADVQYIAEKIDGCKNDNEKSSITKVSKHIPSIMSTISRFRSEENKYNVFIGKDFMKMFYEFLREHAVKIINF